MLVTRKKVQRTNFRKIAMGSLYWTVAGIGSAPLVKIGRRASLGGDTLSTGVPTQTAVTDTTIVAIRVPRGFANNHPRYV